MSDPIEQVRDFLEGPEFAAAARGVIETSVNEAVGGGASLSADDVRRIAEASGGGDLAAEVKPLVADAIQGFLTPDNLQPIVEPMVQMAISRALKRERTRLETQVREWVEDATG